MAKIISKIISIVPRPQISISLIGKRLVWASAITVILLHVLLAGGCKKTPPPSQLSAPVQLKSSDDPWLETSSGVAKTAGDGWKLFVFGYGKGLSAKLSDFTSNPVATLSAGLPPPPKADTGHWANDQQTVQLANGDVLLSWNGYSKIYDANLEQNAVWWNNWPTLDKKKPKDGGYSAAREGVRPAQLFWRYSAANDTWSATGVLDSAYAGGMDKNNTFKADHCASGVPWVVGFDRPELYADPWGVNEKDNSQQRLYLSTSCQTVAFNSNGNVVDKNGAVPIGAAGVPVDDESEQVFVSPDSGLNWEASKFRLNKGVTAMTATSSGRLFMLQYGSSENGTPVPVVYFSDDLGQTLSPETPFEKPIDASYREGKKPGDLVNVSKVFPTSPVPFSTVGLGPPFVYPPAIGAVGPSAVIVVYPSQESFSVPGDVDSNGFSKSHFRQVAVVTMLIAVKGHNPVVIPVAIIRAKSEFGSVVMTGLITDHRAVANPASLLYWMETTSIPSDPVGVNSITCEGGPPIGVAVRYVMFAGPSQFPGSIETLSDPAGFQRCPPPGDDPKWSFGDYMKGGSYFDAAKGTVNFVPVWSQEIMPSIHADHLVQPFARIVPLVVAAKQETQQSVDLKPPSGGVSAPKGKPGVPGLKLQACDFCGERDVNRVPRIRESEPRR